MLSQVRSRSSPRKEKPAVDPLPRSDRSSAKQRGNPWTKVIFLLVLSGVLALYFAMRTDEDSIPTDYEPEMHHVEVDEAQVAQAGKFPVKKDDCTCRRQEATKTREQVYIMGLHHSATSPLTRVMVAMGFNAGPKRGLLLRKDNPLKYWELAQAVKRNQQFINAYYRHHEIYSKRSHNWVGWGFNEIDTVDTAQGRDFAQDTADIAKKMDRDPLNDGEPWIIKDPRLALTGRPWLEGAESPFCVILIRNPVEAAYRFLGYNDIPGNYLNVKEWALVWEEYTVRSIYNCRVTNTPIVFVSYRQFSLDPFGAMSKLYDDMKDLGVDMTRIKKLGKVDVLHTLGGGWIQLHKEKFGTVDHYLSRINKFKVLTPRAINLWNSLADGYQGLTTECLNCLDSDVLAKSSWSGQILTNKAATEAYAHFLDDVSEQSLRRMKVLAASILEYDSSRDLVAIVRRHSVSKKVKLVLEQHGWMIYYVNDFGEFDGCVDFEQGAAKDVQMPNLFYHQVLPSEDVTQSVVTGGDKRAEGKDKKQEKKKQEPEVNTVNLISYSTVAFLSGNFMITALPEQWFATNEAFVSAANGELAIVNYDKVRAGKPVDGVKPCGEPQPSTFQAALTKAIGNVCHMQPRSQTIAKDFSAVYWREFRDNAIASPEVCSYPWTIADVSNIDFSKAGSAYADKWLFLDAVVGKTTEIKQSKK